MSNPRVSILLPVLDEESNIDDCLESLADQDFRGEIEVIVSDGGSTDRTRELVGAWATRIPLLQLIDNPRGVQSHGLNLAAQRATGDILIRADAHTTYAPDYVRMSVESLEETGATAVGGVQAPSGRGSFGRAVAGALVSPLAVGGARYRHATERVEADTVYLGAVRKSDWERLGGWRTLPSRVAEDADLYYRWRAEGSRVMVEPRIRSVYRPRETPGELWSQFYRYGLGKADMLYVNGRWPSWRPLGPTALVTAILAGLLIGLAGAWWPLVAVTALWLLILLVAARGRPLTMVAVAIMHLSYGLGLLRGLLRRPASVRAQVE